MREDSGFGLREWLGFREPFDYSSARWVGPIISCLFITLVGILFVLAISNAIMMLGSLVFGSAPLEAGKSLGVGAVTVSLIGAPFVIWRSIVAQKQADIAEQGLITDRINKAVEGLGAEKTTSRIGRSVTVNLSKGTAAINVSVGGKSQATRIQWLGAETQYRIIEESLREEGEWQVFSETEPNLEVRIGAMYALGRIMQDSPRDHVQVMEILCSYVRQNVGLNDPFHLEVTEPSATNIKPRPDIDAAIKVIGRRSERMVRDARSFLKESTYRTRFDLRNVDLTGADLRDLDFSDIDFSGSSFRGANTMKARFNNVLFNGSDFSYANTRKARADRSTIFSYCLFGGLQSLAIVEPLERDQVLSCALRRTRFGNESGLEAPKFNRADLFSIWFGDGSVDCSYPLWTDEALGRPAHWPTDKLSWDEFVSEWRKWQAEPRNYTPPKQYRYG